MFQASMAHYQGTQIKKKTVATVITVKGLDRNIKYLSTLHGSRNSMTS